MGRVAPGTTIRLYTQAFHDTCMHPFDEAEMLHTGLEKAVLEVRLLLSEFGSPTELLSQAMSPPKPARIRLAVSQLFESGAFMSLDEMSVVTDFGRLAAGLPVDLACSKLVHLGFVFGCLPDAIVMAAAQSLQDIFLMPSSVFLRDRGQFVDKLSENFAARVKADGGLYSEPLAYLAMYKDWITSTKKRRFADTLGVCLSRAGHMDSIVSDITSKMIPLLESGRDLDMLLKSERLKKCSLGRGQEQGDIDDIFCKDTNLLRVILAGACAPNFLIGEFRNSKAIEGSGFEKPCTLQFSGVSKELSSEKPFRMAFEHLKFKIEKYKKIEEGKVLVQMAVHRSDATKDDAAASEKSKKLVIHDLNFVSKLVFQLFHNESKHCLLVPNPNFRPGWDEAQHATVASVTAHRLLSWRTASCSNVKLYWRSPLGSVCDFRPDDDAVRYAVALSIRGVNENSSTEFAGGVSLLPSGLFGKVLQMVFTTPSAELVAETDVHRTVVFSCKIDGLSVVFEPSVLTLEDIAVVNRMRKVVSKSFTSLFPSGDIPLEEAVYKDTASDAIGVLIRLLERCGDSSRHQPASSGPRQEVPFCMEVSTDYLPQLSLDSDPRSDPEDDLDGDYGILSSADSDVPQIEAASRAVALSCLHFFLKRKDFPTKAAHLNRWLESRSSRIGGSIHEELCDTVWPDLKGLKIKQARVRINNLLLSLKCVAKIKRGRLTWDMQQVEGMVRDEDAPDGGGAVDVAGSVTKTALRDDREEISRTSLRMSSTPEQSLTAFSGCGEPWAPPSVVSLSDAIPTACCRSPSAAAKCSGTSGSCYTVSQTQRCVADLARHEGGGNALNLSPDGLRTGIASSGNMDAACSHGAAGSVIRKMQVTVTAQDAATDCSACAAMEAQNSPTGNASDPLHSGRSGGHNSVFGADSSLRGCDAGLSVVAETRLVALDSVALDPGDIANAELGQASQVHDCRVPGEESTYPPLTADVCELDPIVMARFYGADGLSHRRADRGSHAQVQGAATTADAPADGPQASPVMIARYQEDGKWYRCRLAGMSANGLSVVVVFCGYEDDGVQETPWDCVMAVEPGLAEALAARYLEGQGWELMARICGTLGLYQVAQLQYVTDADIAGLGLRPVQRNALLALVQDHRCCSRAVLASEG